MNSTYIDYLSMRIMDYRTPTELIECFLQLNPDDFSGCTPDYHYRGALRFAHITVYYNGTPQMGMCVEMTGQGCQEYCSSLKDPGAIIRLFHCLGTSDSVARLDIAFDDHDGPLDLDLILQKADASEIRTRCQTIRSFKSHTGNKASTLYIGSEKSEYMARIYNKAAETNTDGHWIRAEETLRKNLANIFIRNFLNSVDPTTPMDDQLECFAQQGAQLFLGRIAFIDKDDSNISRCSVCEWWTGFLETATPLKITTNSRNTDDSRTNAWLEKVVAPSLAAMVLIQGPSSLIELLSFGIDACFKPYSSYRFQRSIYEASGRVPFLDLGGETKAECLHSIYSAIGLLLEENSKQEGSENCA